MVIDTNALSAWAEGDQTLLQVLAPLDRLMLPMIVVGEYKQGIMISHHRDRLTEWLNRTVNEVRLGLITLATTDMYARVRLITRDKGQLIPTNDAWIAAVALEHQLPVLSRDRHFDVVDGLQRVSW